MAVFRHVLQGRLQWEGSIGGLLRQVFRLFADPLFYVGLGLFGFSTLLWLLILASQKLSLAYPIQIGLVIVLSGLVAGVVFREQITISGYVGYALVIAGVFMVSR